MFIASTGQHGVTSESKRSAHGMTIIFKLKNFLMMFLPLLSADTDGSKIIEGNGIGVDDKSEDVPGKKKE